jgi:hypothetical protein
VRQSRLLDWKAHQYVRGHTPNPAMLQAVEFLAVQPLWMKVAFGLLIVAGVAWFLGAINYYHDSKRSGLAGTPPAAAQTTRTSTKSSTESAASKDPGQIGSQSTALPRSEPTRPTTTEFAPSQSTALKITKGDLLVLKGSRGIAVVELTYLDGCKATYRWRYGEKPRGHETTGAGEFI